MEIVRQVLLKIGVIALLAGFFPPAAHLFDALTCETAEAIVEEARLFGPATVTFKTAAGRSVTAHASRYHVGNRAVKPGDRIVIIHRSWNPQSLAPHRNIADTLIGLGAMIFGAALLIIRNILISNRPTQPAPAPGRTPRPGPPRPPGRTATPGRIGAVQRERGWLSRT